MRVRVLPVLLVLLAPARALATWSVVGVDADTREVGVAGASCIGGVDRIAGLVPDVAAVAAQAQLNEATRDFVVDQLAAGATPQQALDAVYTEDFAAETRQYGVAALTLETAVFTGADTFPWAGAREGTGVTTEGNILTGAAVVDDALAAFEADGPGGPWTLADRLLAGLEAGAGQGGDSRCSPEQAALSSFLKVALPGDDPSAPYIDLVVPEQAAGGDNPVVLLRALYDDWRTTHPREESDSDSDSDGDSDVDVDVDADADVDGDVEGDGDDSGGCGCQTAAPADPIRVLLLALSLVLSRRSR
jgi:uncharacterized Ntn-hydrolase superfamily protein